MKKYLALISASIIGAGILCASPAMATHDDLNWSITIGNPGYSPPVAYSPPPRVYSPPPRVVYREVQPVVVERRTIVRHGHPYGHREHHWREAHRDHHRHSRHGWHHHRHHDRHGHHRYNY